LKTEKPFQKILRKIGTTAISCNGFFDKKSALLKEKNDHLFYSC